jgi:hypothetical protein
MAVGLEMVHGDHHLHGTLFLRDIGHVDHGKFTEYYGSHGVDECQDGVFKEIKYSEGTNTIWMAHIEFENSKLYRRRTMTMTAPKCGQENIVIVFEDRVGSGYSISHAHAG